MNNKKLSIITAHKLIGKEHKETNNESLSPVSANAN